MADFNPQKLKVRYILPVSPTEPLKGRKYTLTGGDDKEQLTLDIGADFNRDVINPHIRDEIVAEWQNDWQYRLLGRVYIDQGEMTVEEAQQRYDGFKKFLTNALQGVALGDRSFLSNYPLLLDAPIYFIFESNYPELRKIYYFGTLKQYINQYQYEI